MNLVTRIKTKNEIDKLDQLGIDVFCLDTKFTAKKIQEFQLNEIKELIKMYPERIYILINKMIHESDISPLYQFLKELCDTALAGIVINDFSVYLAAKEYHLENLIIYQPGTYNTDTYSKIYLAKRNLKGLTISREITLEEIKKFKNNDLELSIIGHGYLDMFYSKRALITNYFIHKGIEDIKSKNNYHLSLNEEIRPNDYYPILEDAFGTHIFRSKKLISYEQVNELFPLIKDFFIERIFMTDEELFDSIKLYKHQLELKDFLKNIMIMIQDFISNELKRLKVN